MRRAAQAGHATGRGGAGFAGDAAFAAVTGLAQGDVQVHQARRGDQAFGVDGLAGTEAAGGGTEGNDLAGFQMKIGHLIQATGRVDNASANNAELHWAFSCSN